MTEAVFQPFILPRSVHPYCIASRRGSYPSHLAFLAIKSAPGLESLFCRLTVDNSESLLKQVVIKSKDIASIQLLRRISPLSLVRRNHWFPGFSMPLTNASSHVIVGGESGPTGGPATPVRAMSYHAMPFHPGASSVTVMVAEIMLQVGRCHCTRRWSCIRPV